MSDTSRDERECRLEEIADELRPLHARIQELGAERRAIESTNAREDWPDGPFTLHYWQHFSEETDEYNTPIEALAAAKAIEDYGTGSTVQITDRHGNEIYDLGGYPPTLIAAGYPEAPADPIGH